MNFFKREHLASLPREEFFKTIVDTACKVIDGKGCSNIDDFEEIIGIVCEWGDNTNLKDKDVVLELFCRASKLKNAELSGRLSSYLFADVVFSDYLISMYAMDLIRSSFWKTQAFGDSIKELGSNLLERDSFSEKLSAEISVLVLEGKIADTATKTKDFQDEHLRYSIRMLLVKALAAIDSDFEGAWKLATLGSEWKDDDGAIHSVLILHLLNLRKVTEARALIQQEISAETKCKLLLWVALTTELASDLDAVWEQTVKLENDFLKIKIRTDLAKQYISSGQTATIHEKLSAMPTIMRQRILSGA